MAAQETDVNINPADETIRPRAARRTLSDYGGQRERQPRPFFEPHGPGRAAAGGAGAQSQSLRRDHHGIEGVLTWTVDDKTYLCSDPGRPSAFRAAPSTGSTTPAATGAKALCVITSAAIGPQYFHESAAVLNAAAGGPPDQLKMADIMRRHGLRPLRLSPPHVPAKVNTHGTKGGGSKEDVWRAVVVAPGAGRFIAVGSARTGATRKGFASRKLGPVEPSGKGECRPGR